MREPRRVRAFTLFEVLVAAGLMAVVLGAAYAVLSSAMGTALRGMAYSGVLTGISDFTEHLFHDLEQMVVVQRRPGRRAVRIAQDGRRIALLVPRRDLLVDVLGDAPAPPEGRIAVERSVLTTDDYTLHASPVLWRPMPCANGLFVPARGDRPIASCLLSQWSFALTPPAPGSREERHEKERTRRLAGRAETDEQLMRGVMLRSRAPGSPTTFTELDGEDDEEGTPGGVVTGVNPAGALLSTTPGMANLTPGTIGNAHAATAFAEHAEPLYLTIRFTAVDAERRVAQTREILWDLENARLMKFYRNLYAVPDAMTRTVRPGEGKPDDASTW